MALPAPNLDDRRFQDLVDDAKRLVQQRCPEWTDHNVSDPGVTLIEMFAWMTDQLVYRLNRVPDRNYVKFLELIGVEPVPADGGPRPRHVLAVRAAARRGHDPAGDAGRDDPDGDRRGDRLHHRRGPADRPCGARRAWARMIDGKTLRDHMAALEQGTEVYCFQKVPSARRRAAHRPVGGRAVERRAAAVPVPTSTASASTRTNPPLAWEAWTGDDWEACELDSRHHRRPEPRRRRRDPRAARPRRVADRQAAGRLAARPGHRARRGPARVQRLAEHQGPDRDHHRRHGRRRERRDRDRRGAGHLRGRPRPALRAQARPRGPGRRAARARGHRRRGLGRVDVRAGLRGQRAGRPPLHARRSAGEVRLGPAVRLADGALRRYGAVPAKGAHVRLREYRTGGGRRGQRVASGRSACSSRRSRSSPASRTGGRRAAASTARTSRTPRSAARSCCAPAGAPSRPRTTSSSPARPRPRWRACARSPRATARTRARCGS